MMRQYATQRTAARIGIAQAKQLEQADAIGDAVDKKVLKRWNTILRILGEYGRTGRIPVSGQRQLADLLRGMTSESLEGVDVGLKRLARDAHKGAMDGVLSEVPKGLVTLALSQRGMTEAKLSPEQQAQVQAQLFDPLDEKATSDIVYAPSAGRSWQSRIAAQTLLSPPEQVAALVIQGMASGQTVQQLTKSLEPAVQGVRTSARRVARTEGMRVAHAARLQAFEDLGDMVIGYQIHATMDWRVRPHHAARNGNIYFKNPGQSGMLSVADMPNPPIEEDGTVAPNCRCYLTPVFAPDPVIENDPALQALFTDNDKKLIADPVVYGDWFKSATEQERKWAVGVRRLAAATAKLQPGEDLTWAHVLDPETGQLIPADQLKDETEAERLARLGQVEDVLQRRRELAVQVSRFGYIQDPSPPPPPAPVPPPMPVPPPAPVLPLPDYITDVAALELKLQDPKFANKIHKNLLNHDGTQLVSKHYWQQYKAGKLSTRQLANVYNKNLAKLKGEQAQKIRKPAPVRRRRTSTGTLSRNRRRRSS